MMSIKRRIYGSFFRIYIILYIYICAKYVAISSDVHSNLLIARAPRRRYFVPVNSRRGIITPRRPDRRGPQKRMQRNSYCSLSHDTIVHGTGGARGREWRRGWQRAERGTTGENRGSERQAGEGAPPLSESRTLSPAPDSTAALPPPGPFRPPASHNKAAG